MFKIESQTFLLLCEQVLTIFLCIGEYVLMEFISLKMYKMKTYFSHGAPWSTRDLTIAVNGK